MCPVCKMGRNTDPTNLLKWVSGVTEPPAQWLPQGTSIQACSGQGLQTGIRNQTFWNQVQLWILPAVCSGAVTYPECKNEDKGTNFMLWTEDLIHANCSEPWKYFQLSAVVTGLHPLWTQSSVCCTSLSNEPATYIVHQTQNVLNWHCCWGFWEP